jgi:hypothetical protein
MVDDDLSMLTNIIEGSVLFFGVCKARVIESSMVPKHSGFWEFVHIEIRAPEIAATALREADGAARTCEQVYDHLIRSKLFSKIPPISVEVVQMNSYFEIADLPVAPIPMNQRE